MMSKTKAYTVQLVVEYSTDRTFSTVHETGGWVTKPSAAETPVAEGLLVYPSATNNRHPTSLDVVVTKEITNPEPPDQVSTENSTVTMCAETQAEEDIAHHTAAGTVEKAKSETTNTLDLNYYSKYHR